MPRIIIEDKIYQDSKRQFYRYHFADDVITSDIYLVAFFVMTFFSYIRSFDASFCQLFFSLLVCPCVYECVCSECLTLYWVIIIAVLLACLNVSKLLIISFFG